MNDSFWTMKKGPGPIIAVVNHHGHKLRPEGAEADTSGNPEANFGTGTMSRDSRGGLVNRYMSELHGRVDRQAGQGRP